jgi:multidrug transporter EmrE-like cation transporter
VAALILASMAFATGGAFMKPSHGFTRPGPSLAVAVCFVIGAVLLTRAVSHGGLSTTYVVGLGLEAVASIALGLALLGEHVTLGQCAGIGLILAGLVVVHAA